MSISRESVSTTEYGIFKSHDRSLYVRTLILEEKIKYTARVDNVIN